MGVSKNKGTPKWMVYNGNPIKIDDLGVPLFLETPLSFGSRIPYTFAFVIQKPYQETHVGKIHP